MTQRLEKAFKRASRLPEAAQDALADEMLARIEAEEAQPQESDTPFVSAYDVSKHLIGSIEGPGDLSTNPKYMDGFGERSLR